MSWLMKVASRVPDRSSRLLRWYTFRLLVHLINDRYRGRGARATYDWPGIDRHSTAGPWRNAFDHQANNIDLRNTYGKQGSNQLWGNPKSRIDSY